MMNHINSSARESLNGMKFFSNESAYLLLIYYIFLEKGMHLLPQSGI